MDDLNVSSHDLCMFYWVKELERLTHHIKNRLTVIRAGAEYLQSFPGGDATETSKILRDILECSEQVDKDTVEVTQIANDIYRVTKRH